MTEKKSRSPWLPIAAVGGLAAAVLIYSGITNPVPQREYAPRAPGEVAKIPKEQAQHPHITESRTINLELHVSKEDPNLVERVGLSLGSSVIEDMARHAPVFYDVPGVLHQPVQLYPERGMSGFTLTLPKPQSLDGKVLVVYGRDPATRQQKELFKAVLNTKK